MLNFCNSLLRSNVHIHLTEGDTYPQLPKLPKWIRCYFRFLKSPTNLENDVEKKSFNCLILVLLLVIWREKASVNWMWRAVPKNSPRNQTQFTQFTHQITGGNTKFTLMIIRHLSNSRWEEAAKELILIKKVARLLFPLKKISPNWSSPFWQIITVPMWLLLERKMAPARITGAETEI